MSLGLVCDHIRHAELRDIDGVLYANDGDWVESLTALVEHVDGPAGDHRLAQRSMSKCKVVLTEAAATA